MSERQRSRTSILKRLSPFQDSKKNSKASLTSVVELSEKLFTLRLNESCWKGHFKFSPSSAYYINTYRFLSTECSNTFILHYFFFADSIKIIIQLNRFRFHLNAEMCFRAANDFSMLQILTLENRTVQKTCSSHTWMAPILSHQFAILQS